MTTPTRTAAAASAARFSFCGSLFNPKRVVELAEPVLDAVDADHQRLGDRAVARRGRAGAVEQRPAQLDQHAALGRRERRPPASRPS